MENDPKDIVNRTRRALFVFITVAFCLTVVTVMGFNPELTGKVSEVVADGLLSLAMFLSISYVAGSTIDYSGVLARFAQPRRMALPTSEPEEFKGGVG
ncbi:hypothetical protein KEU06_09685 [Pseudaminobacter sp. 19-2017]|uniref:Uncharacterized protein n=1 Tax=Pseudaminobacter soli (ex Zhang et al. 2022) TaxID=2831468 RepID=A0A942DXL1_9HYPH|nr:hypothetical protein [Pseudaminobacter soli]MBS3648877.1 hypothetical protein [Pseudaminobacter soli]